MKKEIIEERRTRFLENLLQEAIINVLAEQAAEPAPEVAPTDTEGVEDVEGDDKEFTIEEMIERLNVIRGGKSFKDNDVYTKLIVFFSKLSEEQKATMRQMLIDIGQVVINAPENEVTAAEVPAPKAPVETAPPAATPPPPAPAAAAPTPAPAAPPAAPPAA